MFTVLFSLRDCLRSRAVLQAEILALRHQLLIFERSRRGHHLRLRWTDRALWVWLSRLWNDWRSALLMVKPETVIGWHRQGFRLYWRWKSRHGDGRPAVSPEVRNLIRQMSHANPRWGAPRIHGELLKIGIELCQATVAKYMVRHRKPPSQTWRTFLRKHTKDLVSLDFFVVPTPKDRQRAKRLQQPFSFVYITAVATGITRDKSSSRRWEPNQAVETCGWRVVNSRM